ncbi:non-receptor tyrosine-protein kinase TYK2 [Stigmatopora argus]
MPGRMWSKRNKQRSLAESLNPPEDDGIHVYLFWTPSGERYLSHTTANEIAAEQLCISAAEAVGITPLFSTLFALYDPASCCWSSPQDVFHPEDGSRLILHYRMRFYFRNWHGFNEKEPAVTRFAVKSETDGSADGLPLLEIKSVEYLFAQAKYEFVNELIPMENVSSEEELNHFKNESLGLAMLHLMHLALQTGKTMQRVAKKTSFEKCIPKSFAKHISEDKVLTKLRIRWMFGRSMRTYQHKIEAKRPDTKELMCKYLCALEYLAPRFGTETFSVRQLRLSQDDQDGSLDAAKGDGGTAAVATHELMVSSIHGLQWRETTCCETASSLLNGDCKRKTNQGPSPPNEASPIQWTPFCDFPEIIHIAINDANVCISTEDNKCMEVEMISNKEARSFISLLDGYYRLTADAHHYLCRELAPPKVLLSEANGLHGPLHDDFVLHKLKKEQAEEEACLVRWSVLDYNRLVLAVPTKSQNGSMLSQKLFCIQYKGSVFTLDGWQQEFSSVNELIDNLKDYILKSDTESYTIKKCCRPQQGELSNLLVKRYGTQDKANRRLLSPNKLDLCFQIKYKDILPGQHLGFGTRTHVYSAHLQVVAAADEQDDDFNGDKLQKVRVVLKVLEQSHQDITFAFFEMASLMSQLSHRHLAIVHGLTVNGHENIMVEEFMEFGPLDVFLRREKSKLTSWWKFLVAKQLASALNYLANKGLVHGNVCARKVLVARQGLGEGVSPLVKLSDPGIPVNMLLEEERLERIPTIAPECLYTEAPIGQGADQWSYGVTLLEICNDGCLPLSGASLSQKKEFYQQERKLLDTSSLGLTALIISCLSYKPLERPSFCSLLRDLIDIMNKNPDISPSEPEHQSESTVYLKRYLKKKRILGKGNFGTVTLYLYDPSNDGTGELVAVKSLKQESSHLSKHWLEEIETLKSLDHTNIVKYKGCCTEMGGQVTQLIMEFLPLGSLERYLQKQAQSTTQCLLFAQQICQGMEYLHSMRYIHRDLAARNILVKNESLVKIADFGLSKYIPKDDNYYRVNECGDSPVFWYALECLQESKFSFCSDVWSFGVMLYEILTRCDPSQSPPRKFAEMAGLPPKDMNVTTLVNLLRQNRRLPCPRDCHPGLRIIVEQCWHQDSATRPSFQCLYEKLEGIPT